MQSLPYKSASCSEATGLRTFKAPSTLAYSALIDETPATGRVALWERGLTPLRLGKGSDPFWLLWHASDKGVPYEFKDAQQLLEDFFADVDCVLSEVGKP